MKNQLKSLLAILIFGLFSFGGCAGKRALPPSTENGLTKSWEYVATVTESDYAEKGLRIKGRFTLVQRGSELSGTFVNYLGIGGRISGELSGERVTVTLSQKGICFGSFDGTGIVNASGIRITGEYAGFDCKGNIEATFVAEAKE